MTMPVMFEINASNLFSRTFTRLQIPIFLFPIHLSFGIKSTAIMCEESLVGSQHGKNKVK